MDDPRIKRLAITLGVSILIILLFKMMLLRTATQVGTAANKAAAEKRHGTPPGPNAIRPGASGVN
jgi:hypothetical protein